MTSPGKSREKIPSTDMTPSKGSSTTQPPSQQRPSQQRPSQQRPSQQRPTQQPHAQQPNTQQPQSQTPSSQGNNFNPGTSSSRPGPGPPARHAPTSSQGPVGGHVPYATPSQLYYQNYYGYYPQYPAQQYFRGPYQYGQGQPWLTPHPSFGVYHPYHTGGMQSNRAPRPYYPPHRSFGTHQDETPTKTGPSAKVKANRPSSTQTPPVAAAADEAVAAGEGNAAAHADAETKSASDTAVRETTGLDTEVIESILADKAGDSNKASDGNEAGDSSGGSVPASLIPHAEVGARPAAVQLGGGVSDTLEHAQEAEGQQSQRKSVRRASDVQVALPQLSLLFGPKAAASEIEEEKDEDGKPEKSAFPSGTGPSANQKTSRIINPPPGFHGHQPVTIHARAPTQYRVPTASTTAQSQQSTKPLSAQSEGLLRLLTFKPASRFEDVRTPQTTPNQAQKASQLLKQPESSTDTMDSQQQPVYAGLTARAKIDSSFPDFQCFNTKQFPKSSQMQQPSNADGPSTSGQQTAGLVEAASTTTGGQAQPIMQAKWDATTNTWISPLADLVGKSDDVAVDRLPWELMKVYYPNGPPRHMGRYIPMPDNWQEQHLRNLRTTTAGMTPEEQARYQAKVEKIFNSTSRFFGMTQAEMVEDVNLRYIFACYLSDLGITRAEFDREYNRYADPLDSPLVPGKYSNMTLEDVMKMRPHEVVEPMLNMAFRNLLLFRAEGAMPEGHQTWRSMYTSDHPAIKPKPKPSSFGVIGDGRPSKGKGKEVARSADEGDEGESSTANATRGGKKPEERMHLPGYPYGR
ncbi:hypothetical protein CONLIGDRAFT_282076 [Coniochaeta ligniaria NRRL 30616]|uniref:Uncharacterized protein n=1 Tax=Coniochaeta ligniaria NRRL 30616 TaxID=1408157 RepID=A0A1J7JMG5_9PEZI|nr:hypothetical protein CONLIGDRAFT_282076 [Coniochaeta ligniaria NRRL 30616]